MALITEDVQASETHTTAPSQKPTRSRRSILGWAAVAVGVAASASLAFTVLSDDGSTAPAPFWNGDVKDHPGYGPVVPAPVWNGDVKDHPGFGPVDPAPVWNGDVKDHPLYDPS